MPSTGGQSRYRLAGIRQWALAAKTRADLGAKLAARKKVEIVATKTFAAVRAEALFASALQPSGSPSPDEVRRTVVATLRRLGASGCAARLAGEFGDHPDIAPARMSWALTTIRTVYQAPSMTLAPRRRALACAT
jgi:hypothetical protein